jgi:thiol:disulfide interchange protein DsbD
MKLKFLSGIFFLLLSLVSYAQVLKPIKWTYEPSKKEIKAGEQIDLIFTAVVEKDWYLYSSDFDPDLGPQVTTFKFKPNDTYELVGKVKPINPKKKYSDTFDGDYTYFIGKGEFRQTVKILKANPQIEGTSEYQVCTDVTGQCIPFEDDFSVTGIKVAATTSTANPAIEDKVAQNETASENMLATTPVDTTSATSATQAPSVKKENSSQPSIEEAVTSTDTQAVATPAVSDNDPYSLGAFMLLAFLAGLAALLTPCVFPMIPMTVTFFTRHSASRSQGIMKALIYGLSIIVLYVLIGTVVSLINGPGFANFVSTHWLPNLLFFFIFILFGLSFLGLFDINIPGSVITKVDAQADKGGYLGVFFMAFTIVLVSFSCTGPLVGSILVESAGGKVIKPVAGMFAFSLAFALPFSLFAIFPQWLSSLPKSGGWLNSVKVVLGFLELALALKFLSIADQVYHWGILDREVFLAFWIVIFSIIGFYLLGKIKLASDPDTTKVSVPRTILAILTFTFVVYLLPGMFGAPLKSLAGYLPPQTTQDFDLNKASTGLFVSNQQEFTEKPKYSEFLKLPHGLKGFFDYKQGLAYAKKVNKPIFIDFTGHGCVNCREMEARVWSNPQVLNTLANEYVVIALYVDDKYELPQSEWYTSTYDNKVKRTIGAQNADFQITNFNNNAQPFYLLLNHNGEKLVEPKAYDLDADKFQAFLQQGIAQFKQGNTVKVNNPLTSR